jgi:hypothetical protein
MSGIVLPPTQLLMLEVLVARHRCGESAWTFPREHRPIAEALESRNLVWWKSGIVERTILVGLTEEGRRECLSQDYVPPILRTKRTDEIRRLRERLAQLEAEEL